MRGINKVTVLGRLGTDPEIREMPSGDLVCNLNMATSEKFKTKSGEYEERTEWHKVVFFAKLAELCKNYLRKGSKLYIEGSLRTERYTDKEGVERYTTKIIGRTLELIDSKQESPQPESDYQGGFSKTNNALKDLYEDTDLPF